MAEWKIERGLPPTDAVAASRDEFRYHKVSATEAIELAAIRREFRELRDYLLKMIPNSRLRSIAITHLGDASRAAIAAAVLAHPDSEPVDE